YVATRPEPPDTRFTGAYALADGTLIFVTPREGKILRYRLMNGESAVLWPTGDGEYEGGPGWEQREPVINQVKFDRAGAGRPGFDWRRADDKVVHARHVDVRERRAAAARQTGATRRRDVRSWPVPHRRDRAWLGVIQRGRLLLRAVSLCGKRLRRAG